MGIISTKKEVPEIPLLGHWYSVRSALVIVQWLILLSI